MASENTSAKEMHPGLMLGTSLGLLALLTLPIMNGGYSGAGYQLGFVILPVAAALCWGCARQRPALAAASLLLILLAGWGMLSWPQAGRELWYCQLQLAAAWVVVWIILTEVPSRSQLVLPAACAGAILTVVYGWFLWTGSGELSYQITSSFGLHNAYAGFLLLAWPAAAAAALLAAPRYRWLYTAAALWLALTLVLTYSRAAWLCFAAQLAALAAYLLWRRFVAGRPLERPLLAGVAGLAVLLVALLCFPPVRSVLARLLDWQGYSMQGRLRFWGAALEIFRDHPLGIGLGNFAYVYPQYQRDWMYYSVDPHSWPLQLLCELGVAGLLLLLILLAGFALWTRRVWRGTAAAPAGLLLILAVAGSLSHAAVDFDYTFGATTALLGAILAAGSWLARQPAAAPSAAAADAPQPAAGRIWPRLASVLTVILLLMAALVGEAFTAERYALDRLRDAPNLPPPDKLVLLEQALRYNPLNFKPRYQLASILAQGGSSQNRDAALDQLDACLKLNPRYAKAWALKALLARPLDAGNPDMERALELDPYNFPEHYFYWANLTADPAQQRERLLLGLERIPAHDPIPPEHIRPTWYELNPLFAEWYFQLAKLTDDQAEKDLYLGRGARFKAYWEEVLKRRGQSAAPPVPGAAST